MTEYTRAEQKLRRSIVTRQNGNPYHRHPWTVMVRDADGWTLLHTDINRASCYAFAERERDRLVRELRSKGSAT